MKIKISLNNQEKTISLATTWSLFVMASLVVLTGLMTYKFTPQGVTLRIPAGALKTGERDVMIRAINLSNVHEVFYAGTAKATVENGDLVSHWTPPKELKNKGFMVEICTDVSGTDVSDCFKATKVMGADSGSPVAKEDEELFSCPYYIGPKRPSTVANLIGANTIDISARVYCPANVTGGKDFAPYSRIEAVQAIATNGMQPQSGLIVLESGQMKTYTYEQILAEIEAKVNSHEHKAIQTQLVPDISQETSSTTSVDSQTLTLSGYELSISGGSTVSLPKPVTEIASSTVDGILSSTDWSNFAAKENALLFDSTFVRTGNTISLMNCASGEIMKKNGSAWICASSGGGGISAGEGISIVNDVVSNTGVLSVSASGALSLTAGNEPGISLATTTDLVQLGNELGLSETGVGAGTYNNVTVDAQGRVTKGTNITYLTNEADGAVGNEIADVVNGGGLVMTGSGTTGSPYKVGLVTTCGDGNVLKYTSASGWACASDIDTDTDTNTDAQSLSYNTSTNMLSIGGGNTVDLSDLAADTDTDTDKDEQAISLNDNTLVIERGGSVNLSGYLDNTDSQALSISGNVISLTNGGSITLPTTAGGSYTSGEGLSLTNSVFAIDAPTCAGSTKLQWNGSAFVCATDVDTDTDTNTDAQTMTWDNGTRTLSISGGNSVTISDADTNTDQQSLSYDTTTRVVSISGGTGFTLPLSSISTTGLLSDADWDTFNGKENVLSFSDGLARSGNGITLMDCAANEVLQRNGGDTAWLCASQVVDTDTDTNTTYSAGTGITLTGTTFALEGTNITQGTYNNVTVDTLGRVTAGTNVSYLTSEADAVIGNEVAGVVNSGGLVMSGAGTSGDPYKLGLITTCGDNQLLKYTAAGGWACAADVDTDTDTNTDAQTLSYNTSTNVLSIGGGNTVDLSELAVDNDTDTDEQAISLNGDSLELERGGSVDLSAYMDNTDSQSLSITGNVISLSNGGSVTLPASSTANYSAGDGLSLTDDVFAIDAPTCAGTTKLQWDGSAFVCAADIDTDTDTNTDQQSISYDAATHVVSISGGTGFTFPLASTSTIGVLSDTDWDTFNGKENVLSFSDGLARSGNAVSLMDCAANQVLQRNGADTAWLCANQVVDTNTDTDTTYSAGTGITLTGTTFALEGTNITQGTYNNVTVDTLGRVTGTSNVSYLTSETDAVVGNEVAGVVNSGGLVMSGAGTFGDPYKLGLITTCGDNQLLKYTAVGGWACAADIDTDTNTDAQSLSYNTSTNILTIAGGNTVDLTTLKDNTDSQSLNIIGNTISLTNGGSVSLPSDQNTTYSNGNGISLTGTVFAINSPTCAGTAKLQWNGTAFVCATDQDTTYTAGTGISITSGSIATSLGTDINSTEILDDTIAAADLATSGATAGTYGDTGVQVAQLTVNNKGQVTSVSNRTISNANATTTGILSSTDWNTFNGKENVLAFTGNGLFSRSGNTVTGLSCATSGHVATWNGSAFNCQAPASNVSSLNSLNGALTLATGSTGADFSVAISGSTLTFNLPNASTSAARGAVTNNVQTFGGAKTFNTGGAAVAFQVTDGTVPHFTIDTTNKKISIGSDTADANAIQLVLDSYNVASDPSGTNGAMYYNSSFGKFRCYEGGSWKDCISTVIGVKSYIDTTVDAVIDAATTNYWDVAAENGNTSPNITLTNSASEVMGFVSMEVTSSSNTDVEVVGRVVRGIGSVPACNTGTQVGGNPGTFSTNTGGIMTSSVTFIDSPNTIQPVYYILCSDAATVGTGANISRIRITLQEVVSSN